jgi:hypothetical protein
VKRINLPSKLNLRSFERNKSIDVQNILDTCDFLSCHKTSVSSLEQNALNNIEDFNALCWDRDGKPYTVVSKDFGILNHKDVVEDTFKSLDKTGLRYNPVSFTVNNGPKRNSMKMSVLLPDLSFEIDGSPVFGVINVLNGNDSFMTYRREFAFFRLICTNGMAVFDQDLFFESHRHTSKIEMISIEEGFKSLERFQPQFCSMLESAQAITLTDGLREAFKHALKLSTGFMAGLPQIFDKYDSLVHEKYSLNTLWGLYQVMTNYLSNETEVYNIVTAQVQALRLYNFVKATIANPPMEPAKLEVLEVA